MQGRSLIRLNRKGLNRWVVLTKRWAIKFPSPRSWQDFLFGLLNNMKEAGDGHLPGRCPVVAKLPLGLAIVMPRAEPLNDGTFVGFDSAAFCARHGLRIEHKPDSYGHLNGEIVALDYGWESPG